MGRRSWRRTAADAVGILSNYRILSSRPNELGQMNSSGGKNEIPSMNRAEPDAKTWENRLHHGGNILPVPPMPALVIKPFLRSPARQAATDRGGASPFGDKEYWTTRPNNRQLAGSRIFRLRRMLASRSNERCTRIGSDRGGGMVHRGLGMVVISYWIQLFKKSGAAGAHQRPL